jgi:DNA-binding NtrC family response regulator
MDQLERHAILKTMESVGGSTSRAAEILGISVRKIQYKLQEYSVAPKGKAHSLASPNAGKAHN